MTIGNELTGKARGVLVGLACGDALGAPVEFKSREEIRRLFPDGVRDFGRGGWMNVEPGELTDDSRMAIDLAEVLSADGPLDMTELGRSFVAWVEEGPKDVGNTTAAAISHLRTGVAWQEAGERALAAIGERGAASNGSLMRAAPVAIRYWNDPAALQAASLDTSRITHAEPRCQWACVALNQAIAHALGGGHADGLVDAALTGVDVEAVIDAVRRAGELDSADLRGSGYVLNALQIAFWAVHHQSSFEECLVAAVMIGDDTDTNAAVTGALAGALYGYDAIPARWTWAVQSHDRLIGLADRLLAQSIN
jgi:ADP-ribosyl-[dinitrogen reductase] hydrolase